ncbi:MAG TPA: hypothetical protein VHS26_05340, partial [Solirubrobacteraceae bacterium]|nr:hypothetical protein [Solirubrobacteraceae bacterium]
MSDRQASETEEVDEGKHVLAAQSRTLRTSLISLAIFFAIVTALLVSVPDLRSALDGLADADPSLIGAAVCLELLS